VKKGLGTLTMTGNSVDFHGDVEIQQGIVVATHMNALGRGTGATGVSTLNTISVSKGAQLRATFLSDKSDNSEGRGFRSVVKIAGDGPDGSGAFYYDPTDTSTLPYWLIYKLVLTDDASIGGTANYFARSLDMNSKTLTVDMKSMLHFYWTVRETQSMEISISWAVPLRYGRRPIAA
jgi:autotransporter-associated beta strand protein